MKGAAVGGKSWILCSGIKGGVHLLAGCVDFGLAELDASDRINSRGH